MPFYSANDLYLENDVSLLSHSFIFHVWASNNLYQTSGTVQNVKRKALGRGDGRGGRSKVLACQALSELYDGVLRARYGVLTETDMPFVLLRCLFRQTYSMLNYMAMQEGGNAVQ